MREKITNLKEAYKISKVSPMFYSKTVNSLVLFSYHFVDPAIFQDYPETRELRGIIFDSISGEVIARPFPKFFNLGEDACTVTVDTEVSANEKIDGSLVTAFVHNQQIQLASKGSLNSWVVQEATQLLTANHKKLVKDLYDRGYTTIFEYISKDKPVVIHYPHSNLVFVGARSVDSGEMMTPEAIVEIAERYNVPYAHIQFQNVQAEEIKKTIRNEEGIEGVVAYADSSNIAKIKTEWYFLLNRYSPMNLTEKQIRKAFFDGTIDDIYSSLPEASKKRVNEVIAKITKRIEKRVKEVSEFFETVDTSISRKEFALLVQKLVKPEHRGIYYAVQFHGKSVEEAVFEYFKKHML